MSNLKITNIEAFPYALPTRRKFRWASLKDQIGGFVFVKIETNEGIIGYVEATPSPDWGGDFNRYGGNTLNAVCDVILNVIKPLLLGTDPTNVAQAHMVMEKYIRANSYAKCAVDIALYDIWGKMTNQPVYQLLGGKVREKLPIAHMIGIMSLEEAVEEAKLCYQEGMRAFQIKGGEDFKRDIKVVKALREEFGEDVWLRLDANKGYGEVKTALNVLRKMTDKSGLPLLDMVEQPVGGLREMSIITDKISMKTITDESTWNVSDAFESINMRASDAISIYIGKAGGLYEAQKVAMLAHAYNIPCDINGIESSIGNAANLHFALSQPSHTIPCVITMNAPEGKHHYKYGGHFYSDDICVEAFPVADGCLLPLEGPGLGIEIDLEKINQYRLDK